MAGRNGPKIGVPLACHKVPPTPSGSEPLLDVVPMASDKGAGHGPTPSKSMVRGGGGGIDGGSDGGGEGEGGARGGNGGGVRA